MRYAIVGATIEDVRDAGGTGIKETRSIGVIFANLTEDQARKLKDQGFIVSVVGEVKATVMPPTPIAATPTYTPSNLIAIAGYEELRGVVDPPLYGAGMNLAIVDTGIRETHEQVRGRVVYRKNFTSDPMRDGFDHGTGTASIALSLAPECNILDIKVLDDKGQGTEEELVFALDHLIELRDLGSEYAPHVINLSLGGPDDGNTYNPVRMACREAIRRGVWVFAAAGNGGPGARTIMSPACEQYVFAAGSARYLIDQKTFVVSDFSSRGPTLEGITKPDAVLFGEDMIMASSVSDTDTVYKSGTSFASPFGAGMGLLYLEGVIRRARTLVEMGELPAAEMYYVPPDVMIDQYFPRVCIKPAGALSGKDYEYGYGLPFGPLIAQAVQPKTTVDVGSIIMYMLPVMMMGMVIPMMGRGE